MESTIPARMPSGIQVNVTDQSPKIPFPLAKNGFVPVLEQVALTVMSAIEIARMSGQ